MTEGIPATPIAAAAVTGAASLLVWAINAWLTGYRERVNRRREVFAKAFAAAVGYEEFPYIVRRRRTSNAEDERIRISSELRQVQEDISYYSAWLFTESWHVSRAYETLIRRLRETAGNEIRKAWCTPPIGEDTGMNMPDLGLASLQPFKLVYLTEVADELAVAPRWLRRLCRCLLKIRAILHQGDESK